jgi:hypothetical protein
VWGIGAPQIGDGFDDEEWASTSRHKPVERRHPLDPMPFSQHFHLLGSDETVKEEEHRRATGDLAI